MSSYLITETIRLRMATVEFYDNGIINFKLDDNTEVTLSDSKEQFEVLRSRYDGKTKFKILVEPGRYTSISKEAREFSTLPDSNAMTAANAVVVQSLAHRLVINFVITFVQKQSMKMRMFDSKEKAIEWLLSIKV